MEEGETREEEQTICVEGGGVTLKDDHLFFDPYVGRDIRLTAERMVKLADWQQMPVRTVFNGISLEVLPGDDPEAMVAAYWEESDRRREEWRNSPEGKAAIAEQERATIEYGKRAAAAREEGIPEFSLRDPEGWKLSVEVNDDPYGSAVIRFAARWCKRMEDKLLAGYKLEDIADETAHDADDEGISGFQYGCAVGIISQVWEFGDRLRRWHNLKTQFHDEGERANESGGVLNPAVMVIGD